jgi:hypothetical protein
MSLKTYYACIQDGTLKEHIWISIPAKSDDEAWHRAYNFYRMECDLSNDDLQALCIMESHYNDTIA